MSFYIFTSAVSPSHRVVLNPELIESVQPALTMPGSVIAMVSGETFHVLETTNSFADAIKANAHNPEMN